ncbi:MAG: flagellar hook-basal body protein [Oscillospiraceae bacterium]|jgi:flagellar basal-body rod protein FlgF|nr:flagellar hook-basal body protein [Oscillospiraceae bacterium]
MFKGFYQLTSAMLSQGRRLDVVSHNMTNISTAGYKLDRYTDSTFQDVLISRVGNKNKAVSTEMGEETYILAPSELVTDFTQGSMEETTLPLDFAIIGDGFFAIDRDGDVAYTRNGSFNLDDEGYLCLWGQGRVLNSEGQPIQLPTDHIYVNKLGEIYTEADRNYLGTLGIYATENTEDLERNEYGLFTGGNFQLSENYEIRHRMVERSNVNMVEEMVLMMSSQRALQSAAQMSKIYDAVMSKATTELGRMG